VSFPNAKLIPFDVSTMTCQYKPHPSFRPVSALPSHIRIIEYAFQRIHMNVGSHYSENEHGFRGTGLRFLETLLGDVWRAQNY